MKEYNATLVKNNIHALLEEKELSISKFEKEMGVSTGYVSRTFKESTRPNIDFIIKVADFFHVGVERLLFTDLSALTPNEEKMIAFINKLLGDTSKGTLKWHEESGVWATNLPSVDNMPQGIVYLAHKEDDTYTLSMSLTNQKSLPQVLCQYSHPSKGSKAIQGVLRNLYHTIDNGNNVVLSDVIIEVIDAFMDN